MYMYQGCQHSQLKYPVPLPKYPNFAPLIYPEISYKIVQTILIIGHYIAWGRCIIPKKLIYTTKRIGEVYKNQEMFTKTEPKVAKC